MASLATANLPSSDEEDDDYDPSKDPTGEKEAGQQAKAAGSKRGFGAIGESPEAADGDRAAQPATHKAQQQATTAADDDILTPAQAAKKARISAMFEQLHESATGSANKLSRNTISLASLCSNTNPKKKRNTDLLWMRNLGMTATSTVHDKAKQTSVQHATDTSQPAAAAAIVLPAAAAAGETPADAIAAAAPNGAAAATPEAANGDAGNLQQQQQQPEQNVPSSTSSKPDQQQQIRSAAAAALAAAKEAAVGGVSKTYNKISVTETRRFAGKDIEVTVEVDKDSKAAKKAAERSAAAATGLDAFLNQIEGKKKVSVLDKSKMDWQDFKQTDVDVQEELEAHRRSDKQYLDKQEFLQRAELREYEIERDKRLASDVRLRGRL